MSIFFHDHSSEGFNDEWAKAMQPAWDKCAAEREAEQAKWDALTIAEQELATERHKEYVRTYTHNALNKLINPEPVNEPSAAVQLGAIDQLNSLLKDN